MYSVTVLEASSPKLRFWQDRFLVEILRENLFLDFLLSSGDTSNLWYPCFIETSFQSLFPSLGRLMLFVSSPFLSFLRTLIII